jgi:hypothetical protein
MNTSSEVKQPVHIPLFCKGILQKWIYADLSRRDTTGFALYNGKIGMKVPDRSEGIGRKYLAGALGLRRGPPWTCCPEVLS